jgi:hypothetical protein
MGRVEADVMGVHQQWINGRPAHASAYRLNVTLFLCNTLAGVSMSVTTKAAQVELKSGRMYPTKTSNVELESGPV